MTTAKEERVITDYAWPCPLCYGDMTRTRRFIQYRGKRITLTTVTCDDCGASVDWRSAYDPDHDELINKKREL